MPTHKLCLVGNKMVFFVRYNLQYHNESMAGITHHRCTRGKVSGLIPAPLMPVKVSY